MTHSRRRSDRFLSARKRVEDGYIARASGENRTHKLPPDTRNIPKYLEHVISSSGESVGEIEAMVEKKYGGKPPIDKCFGEKGQRQSINRE